MKNTGSPYFEEAYFILKDKGEEGEIPPHKKDMVSEAMKIIDSSLGRKRQRLKKGVFPALCFIAGAAAAAVLFLLIK